MHTVWTRLNSVFFSAAMALAIMSAFTAFSTYLLVRDPMVETIAINRMRALQNYQGTDKAIVTFDLDADLRPLFNWNVKQLFVYVVAEYQSTSNKLNQVVIWDYIARTEEDAIFKLKDEQPKYFLADKSDELRNAEIELKLMWDMMPISGRLFIGTNGTSKFQMPTVYKSDEQW